MKKWWLLLCTLSVILLLGACNKELSKEEVIAELKDREQEVEKYHADIDLGVEIVNTEQKSTLESSRALLKTDLNEKKLEGHGIVQEETNGNKASSEYYFKGEEAYLNANNQGWMMVPNPDVLNQDGTFYKNLVKLITAIEDKVEIDREGDSYILTFKGKDLDVYRAFEDPYSVSFTGIKPEDVVHDITIRINTETFYIERLQNTLTGEQGPMQVIVTIDHQYEKMNEIDEIEIPAEVKQQATY